MDDINMQKTWVMAATSLYYSIHQNTQKKKQKR